MINKQYAIYRFINQMSSIFSERKNRDMNVNQIWRKHQMDLP